MKKFLLFVVLQVLVLVYMVGSQYAVEWYGREVRLQTAPVDPTDVFYGDYVTLNYEISTIPTDKFDRIPEQGDTVYVVLKKEGTYYQLDSAYLTNPSISADQAVLKGRVNDVVNQWNAEDAGQSQVKSAHIVYGLERYYVSEGTGKELENKRGQFDVVVKTSSWGQHLSSLSFIANDVLTQREVQDLLYQYYEKQSKPIDITSFHLVPTYETHQGPVWLVQIAFPQKSPETPLSGWTLVAVDAKTGKILNEKKLETPAP